MNEAKTFKQLTAASVHVPTADDGKKRARSFRAVIGDAPAVAKRSLHPHDADTAKTPFTYDVNALGSLRPDQVPRFFGALTDQDKQEDKTVKLADLVAMQDRVDPKKVEAMRGRDRSSGKPALVVRHNGKDLIADGHHRLAADWMNGAETADVKYKDLEPVTSAVKARDPGTEIRVAKVDASLGVVFGWAVICKVNGQDYYDWNVDHVGEHKGKLVPEHIPEPTMMKAGLDFMHGTDRAGNLQHAGPDAGTYVFAFPLTTDVAEAMGITCEKTGLMVGYKPPKDILAKYLDGSLTGFSIEGFRGLDAQEHD